MKLSAMLNYSGDYDKPLARTKEVVDVCRRV